ncbi:histidine phosphatase family protein [Bradyrhizobium sp. LjRoot220]
MKRISLFLGVLLLFSANTQAFAGDSRELIAQLKQGNYVIIFRHGATDDSQKDIHPFKFDDMKAQRQLNEKGRETARQIGAALKAQDIPVGDVYTSKLNRAVETGQILSGKEVRAVDALTDSGGGSASSMANPTGANAKAGLAIRELVNAIPKPGTNNLLVTHKTNFADAFGKEAGDVGEAEAFVYQPKPASAPVFVGRIKAADWTIVSN